MAKNSKILSSQQRVFSLALLLALGLGARAEDHSPVEFSGLLQSWLVSDASVTAANPNFRLRRAELKASGTPAENLRYFVMFDVAKSITGTTGKDNSVLQDLGIAVRLAEGWNLTLGQFKTQTTAEGLVSSAALPLPERSLVGRFFGDKREPGAMLSYKKGPIQGAVMISNGQGANSDDVDDQKDLSARIDVQALDSFSVGAFTLAGNFAYKDLGSYGFNFDYAGGGGLMGHFETAYRKAGKAKGYGWRLDFQYSMGDFEPVIRYEQLKPQDSIDITGIVCSGGVDYHFADKKSKIQAAYSYLMNIDAPNGTPDSTTVALGKKSHVFYLVFQAAF